MQELFSLDMKDYNPDGEVVRRPSVRAVIIQDGKVLLVYSTKYGYYNFPGGGFKDELKDRIVESFEVDKDIENIIDIKDIKETLLREVEEETGYIINPDTIREYGHVLRKQKDFFNENGIFEQDNLYYFCDLSGQMGETDLEEYEREEGYVPVWIDAFDASVNNKHKVDEMKWRLRAGAGDTPDSSLELKQIAQVLPCVKRDDKVLDMLDLEIRKIQRKENENRAIVALGDPKYAKMFEYVGKTFGEGEDAAFTKSEIPGAKIDISYSRFEHTKRVVAWTKRIYDLVTIKNAPGNAPGTISGDEPGTISVDEPGTTFGDTAFRIDQNKLRYDELIVASIFHDIGRNYVTSHLVSHAEAGVPATKEYLLSHGYDEEKAEYICSLVARHSDKHLLKNPDTDPNLVILMEADLMDDMGAQGIVMDCMITEIRNPRATFTDCFDHISRFTLRLQEDNPMVTLAGRKLWDEKTDLVKKFVEAFSKDIHM